MLPWDRKYKYISDVSHSIPRQPVTTESSGMTTASDIVDASTYISGRRANWINRSKYLIYAILLVLAITIISTSKGGWSAYWSQLKDSFSGIILNVFSVILFIDILSVWIIDLTVMRGVEYTYSQRYLAGKWKPTKALTKNSNTYTEFKNTCPGLHNYGRFTWPSLDV